MTVYVALLRGVNLGKRQLKMEDLRRVATELGLDGAKTYIASGNLLFRSAKSEATLKQELEGAIGAHMDARVGVMIRSATELAAVTRADPYADQPGNRVVAFFLDDAPPRDCVAAATNVVDERLALGSREIYVHYPSGQGQSKLRIPAAKDGTARNMNTVAKLAELAREYE